MAWAGPRQTLSRDGAPCWRRAGRGRIIKYLSNMFFLYFSSGRASGCRLRCRWQQVLTQQPSINCPEVVAGNKRISDTIDRAELNNTLSLIILCTAREKECPIKSRSWNSRVRGFPWRADHRLVRALRERRYCPQLMSETVVVRVLRRVRLRAVARRQSVLFIPASIVCFATVSSGVPGRSIDRL